MSIQSSSSSHATSESSINLVYGSSVSLDMSGIGGNSGDLLHSLETPAQQPPAPALSRPGRPLTEPDTDASPDLNGPLRFISTAAIDAIGARYNPQLPPDASDSEVDNQAQEPEQTSRDYRAALLASTTTAFVLPPDNTYLHAGPLARSAIINSYCQDKHDPHWLVFCNKYQALFRDSSDRNNMVNRLEKLVISMQTNPALEQLFLNIAQVSNGDCSDAAAGGLLEMEKAALEIDMINKIEGSDSQSKIHHELLQLAFGLHSFEVMQQLAAKIGRNEAVEIALYFLEDFHTLLKSPILPVNYDHRFYAEEITMDIKGRSALLHTSRARLEIKSRLLAGMYNSDKFADFLAGFTPFQTFINKFEQADFSCTIQEKISDIQNTMQQLNLQLNSAISVDEKLDSMQKIVTSLRDNFVHPVFMPSAESDSLVKSLEELQSKRELLQQNDKNPKLSIPTNPFIDSYSQDIRDTSSDTDNRLHCMEAGLASPPATSSTLIQDQVTAAYFELDVLKNNLDLTLMKVHNNAHKFSYFEQALPLAIAQVAREKPSNLQALTWPGSRVY